MSSVANMGQTGSRDNAMLLKKSQSQGQIPSAAGFYEKRNSASGGGDIFSQIRGTMTSIEKSRSRSDIRVHQQLQKSASR